MKFWNMESQYLLSCTLHKHWLNIILKKRGSPVDRRLLEELHAVHFRWNKLSTSWPAACSLSLLASLIFRLRYELVKPLLDWWQLGFTQRSPRLLHFSASSSMPFSIKNSLRASWSSTNFQKRGSDMMIEIFLLLKQLYRCQDWN